MSDTRQTEKNLLDLLAAEFPNGLTSTQLAQELRVTPETIRQMITRLSDEHGISQDGEGRARRYFADPKDLYRPLNLSLPQSWTLYFALRRIIRAQQNRFYPFKSLTQRLLHTLHPQLKGSQLEDKADLPTEETRFQILIEAWQTHKVAQIQYRPLSKPQVHNWHIAPLWFEPSVWSDANYLIAEVALGNTTKIMNLKLDRIENVRLTSETFQPLPIDDILKRLEETWGIWVGEETPSVVVLHFHPRVARRLQETKWHYSQHLATLPNGFIEWRGTISEPMEMLPWIRGWGSDVEVIAPPVLRQEIIRHLSIQTRQYHLSTDQSSTPVMYGLWAKYHPASHSYHPVIYHLLDVGAVASVMWDSVLSKSQKDWLGGLLHLSAHDTKKWMILLVALHDIGKVSPDFQAKAPALYETLIQSGLPNSPKFDYPHGAFSAKLIRLWLKEQFEVEVKVARPLAYSVGGHHGNWITNNQIKDIPMNDQWQTLAMDIIQLVQNCFGVVTPFRFDDQDPDKFTEDVNAVAVFLSGFTSVCDWLGSMEDYFPFQPQVMESHDYFVQAIEKAETVLSETGWIGWQSPQTITPFETIFQFAPNRLQETVIKTIQSSQKMPKLVIVEYATGAGKTETALYLADLYLNQLDLAGIYVAMPTQATSNQMFGRVASYLQTRYPHNPLHLQLIHGQANQHSSFSDIQIDTRQQGNESGLIAPEWFQNHKRSLLSPFGVGTIDQAMLSVLQARHHFVRQFALSHKVVIFDEIHAYDTYMSTIIKPLLRWLNTLQSPAILLSATLPQQTRHALLEQYDVNTNDLPKIPYPRLTIVYNRDHVEVKPLPPPPQRTLQLVQLERSVDTLMAWLLETYAEGGCIAIICNTVNEAIALTQAIHEQSAINRADVWLFHARFPPEWRKQIETKVLDLFGKKGHRPQRAILVSTQLIEQSLDLDFDVMVTSTAPIDLLIQRAGRVHRHKRPRLPHLQHPTLIIRQPQFESDDIPSFGSDGFVYQPYILLKTWLLLRQHSQLVIPKDIDPWVEFVYGEDVFGDGVSSPYQQAIALAKQTGHHKDDRSAYKAETIIIANPIDDRLIGGNSRNISDNPDSKEFQVATRDIQPNITVVCLFADEESKFRGNITALLMRKITIQHQKIRKALLELPTQADWQHVSQLRETRLLIFEENEVFTIPNSPHTLKLSLDYGLELFAEEE